MIRTAWVTATHLSCIRFSTSSFKLLARYFMARPSSAGPFVAGFSCCVAAMFSCSALPRRGRQSLLQRRPGSPGEVPPAGVRPSRRTPLSPRTRTGLVEQDERVHVLDFRQRWRRPHLHVGRLTAAVVDLGVVDRRPVPVHAVAQLRVALPLDEGDLLFPALGP